MANQMDTDEDGKVEYSTSKEVWLVLQSEDTT